MYYVCKIAQLCLPFLQIDLHEHPQVCRFVVVMTEKKTKVILQASSVDKEAGNEAFKAGNYQFAVDKYTEALRSK